jgi:hypothetical protein
LKVMIGRVLQVPRRVGSPASPLAYRPGAPRSREASKLVYPDPQRRYYIVIDRLSDCTDLQNRKHRMDQPADQLVDQPSLFPKERGGTTG